MHPTHDPGRHRRLGLFLLVFSTLSAPLAQGATDSALIACLEETADDVRLACYDQLARQIAATPQTAAPAAAVVTVPMVQPDSEDDSITSRIVSVSTTPRGHRAFRLENGQTWIEVEVGRQPVAIDQAVTINKRPRRWVMRLEGMPDIGVRLAAAG